MWIRRFRQLHRPGLGLFERVVGDRRGFQLWILPVQARIRIQLRIVGLELRLRLFERGLDHRLLRRSLGILEQLWGLGRVGLVERVEFVERVGVEQLRRN